MKKKLSLLFTLLFFVGIVAAQKPQPLQIQTVNDSTYVVEYIPLPVAQKNVSAQLAQVDKQLAQVEKQMADLLKKRDDLMKQKAALEYAQKQLDAAAITPPPPATSTQSAPATTAPPAEKPKTKSQKPKTKKN